MIYKSFKIDNYKGIKKASINLLKNDLVLLLGLNESGKTTILKAIETFDYLNDLQNESFKSIRNKSDVNSNSPAQISAAIEIDEPLKVENFTKLFRQNNASEETKLNVEAFFKELNENKEVIITRVIPFKNGNPLPYYYKFESEHSFVKDKFSKVLAKELVRICPFIIYFEDFKDRIPDKIFTSDKNSIFNPDWYDIIDGLFYNTDKDFSIEQFKKLYSRSNQRLKDAATVLKRVNKTLNKSFSDKWKDLSGVKDIEDTELTYNYSRGYFEISITDTDGTTYTVDERSKGALWYLSFLMKTEFRRKKLRKNSGKPIFLIDEPASNLHSTAQQNMISDFQKLVEDTSVIYSTHSQYLISLDNIKSTYVVERKASEVLCTLWADYIKKDKSDQTYYQPLANLLNIIPNTFTIPWTKAIITEGPSDMKVISVMFSVISNNKTPDFVIYPGTSAQNLESIISLNLGWGSDFKVILDSDKEGHKAKKKYQEAYELDDSVIFTLPIQNKKIESYFTDNEKRALYEIAFDKKDSVNVSKKEFHVMFSVLSSSTDKKNKIKAILTDETVNNFKDLFTRLNIL